MCINARTDVEIAKLANSINPAAFEKAMCSLAIAMVLGISGLENVQKDLQASR